MFPSNCRICEEPLTRISRLPVCEQCLDSIPPLRGRLCSVCGERLLSSVSPSAPVAGAGEDELFQCPLCRRAAPPFAKAVAYGSYQGGLREMIHILKYGGVLPAAKVLGRMVVEAMTGLEPILGDGLIVVIPVPLHKSKRRQRRFNQAELIARAALKFCAEDRFHLADNVLLRKRDTDSQIGMTTHQRRENMRGAFAVSSAAEVNGKEVLLVDDVLTTGATAAECARVLLRAGAKRVWVATAARTMKLASNEDRLQSFSVSEFQGTNRSEAGNAVASLN
jgi:ComF family protein